MKFDINPSVPLSASDSKLLDSFSDHIIREINSFTEKLFSTEVNSRFSYLTPAFSRNFSQNNILVLFTRVFLLEQKIQNGQTPSEVIVANMKQKKIILSLKKRTNSSFKITIQNDKRNRLFMSNFYRALLWVFSSLFLKIFIKKKTTDDCEIAISYFFQPDSIDKDGKHKDKYFNLHRYIARDPQNKKFLILPFLTNFNSFNDFINLTKNIRKAKLNFFFQESYLTLTDYLKVLWNSYQICYFDYQYPDIFGYKGSDLLKQSNLDVVFSPMFLSQLSRYFFFKKLKQEGMSINFFITWFENQQIDKATSLALNDYFPNADHIGYQGYVPSKQDIHLFPKNFEFNKGVLPKKIEVISKAVFDVYSNYGLKNILLGNAYRYEYLQDIMLKGAPLRNTIFVALPISVDLSLDLIQLLSEIISFEKNNFNFLLKIHPVIRKNKIIAKALKDYKISNELITDKKFSEIHNTIMLMISAGLSSLQIEAIALNIPVAVLSNNKGLTPDISGVVKEKINNKIFYNNIELFDYIRSISQKPSEERKKESILNFGKRKLTISDIFHNNL